MVFIFNVNVVYYVIICMFQYSVAVKTLLKQYNHANMFSICKICSYINHI